MVVKIKEKNKINYFGYLTVFIEETITPPVHPKEIKAFDFWNRKYKYNVNELRYETRKKMGKM